MRGRGPAWRVRRRSRWGQHSLYTEVPLVSIVWRSSWGLQAGWHKNTPSTNPAVGGLWGLPSFPFITGAVPIACKLRVSVGPIKGIWITLRQVPSLCLFLMVTVPYCACHFFEQKIILVCNHIRGSPGEVWYDRARLNWGIGIWVLTLLRISSTNWGKQVTCVFWYLISHL